MHLINTSTEIDMGFQGKIPSGTYVADDIMIGSMLQKCPAGSAVVEYWLNRIKSIRDFIDYEVTALSLNPEPKFLLVRPGAFGDLLFLTPVIEYIKRNYPHVKIDVCCFKDYGQVFIQNPHVRNVIPYPLNYTRIADYDAITFLEGMIERHPFEKTMHAVDIAFDRVLGYIPREINKNVSFYFAAHEIDSALHYLEQNNSHFPREKRIALQVKASTRSRTYPQDRINELIKLLLDKQYEVFLLGFPGEIPEIKNCPKNLHNLSHAKFTFRQSAAILANCHGFIGPDSAFTHVAGGLGIPSVALFAAFPWENRTKYYVKTRAITGRALSPGSGLPCNPCHFHKLDSRDFPESGPCYTSGKCDALASIEPSRIVSTLENLIK